MLNFLDILWLRQDTHLFFYHFNIINTYLRANRAKVLFFHCQICKFVTFLLPSSSWLLKLPIGGAAAKKPAKSEKLFECKRCTILIGSKRPLHC